VTKGVAADAARDAYKRIPTAAIRAMMAIKAVPSAQPDIIRCKDCKHWNPQLKTANGNGLGSCDFHNVALVTSEGFCYWAERGEQNDSEAD
jgi:hypothetical protein